MQQDLTFQGFHLLGDGRHSFHLPFNSFSKKRGDNGYLWIFYISQNSQKFSCKQMNPQQLFFCLMKYFKNEFILQSFFHWNPTTMKNHHKQKVVNIRILHHQNGQCGLPHEISSFLHLEGIPQLTSKWALNVYTPHTPYIYLNIEMGPQS